MPRIRCHYLDCVFLDEGYCSAAAVEVDPDSGCMTYSPTAEMASNEEDWEEEEEMEEWEDLGSEEEEDDDTWVEDDEEY